MSASYTRKTELSEKVAEISHARSVRDYNGVARVKSTRPRVHGGDEDSHHPSPPQPIAAASSASSGVRADEPWQDNLRAARGIVLACIGGALLWALGIAFIVAVWPQ